MEYEDELDRMRARKKRSGSTNKGSAEQNRQADCDNQERVVVRGDRTYYNSGDGRNPRVQYNKNTNRNNSRQDHMHQKAQAERMKKKKRKRRIIIIEVLALIILLAGAYMFLGSRTNQKGYWTIAVFGVDSRDGKVGKGALADVQMICNIDKATGEIKLVSVYRDTYLQIDDDGNYHKINEAYFKGGHKQAVDALNRNLGLKIDDYATFNWKAVAEGINLLGGIDLEITDAEFKYINGFITETVNSTGVGSYQLEHAGMNHLDGVQAVAYARLRLMDTDYARTERQRKVVTLALDKAKQADAKTLSILVQAVMPQISTSVGLDDGLTIAKGISKYHIGETAGFPFSRTAMKIGKMDCVIPTTLESNVIQLHQFLYGDEAYTPNSTVQKISARISEKSGIGEPGKNAPSNNLGGSSSGGGSAATKAPAETLPPETIPETSAEETKETVPETTMEETTEKPTNEDGSLIGPGAGLGETAESTEKETVPKESETEKETEKPKESETPPATEAPKPETPAGPSSEGPGEVGPGV